MTCRLSTLYTHLTSVIQLSSSTPVSCLLVRLVLPIENHRTSTTSACSARHQRGLREVRPHGSVSRRTAESSGRQLARRLVADELLAGPSDCCTQVAQHCAGWRWRCDRAWQTRRAAGGRRAGRVSCEPAARRHGG